MPTGPRRSTRAARSKPLPPAIEPAVWSRGGKLAAGFTLLLLLAHAWHYRFQCDDAFIAFRYARNLADGFGLVFNPGMERVEGFTSFLWVMLLAAFDRLGLAPERSANVLSGAATVALWALVAWFSMRGGRTRGGFALMPLLFLATTRSVAVWSSGGLETRAFEVLVVAGVLRGMVELDPPSTGALRRRPLAGAILGLAALTRPEGLIVAGPVLLAAAWVQHQRRQLDLRWLLGTFLPFATLVLAFLVFRRLYFGDWLPNTYYAKVHGAVRWDWGLPYLGAMALEYGAYLWPPLLAAGVVGCRRRLQGHVPLLFAVAAVPLALSAAAVGGDHFEYRIVGALFPLLFLWLGEGLREVAERFGGRLVAGLAATLVLFGLLWLPLRTRQEFPAEYHSGFPGAALDFTASAQDFLDPERDPLAGIPGLRSVAATHRSLTRFLTSHFVAIRQEEHRLFLAMATGQGERLRALVHSGALPSDTRIAIDCVGAIPYLSDLRVLDRHGLTDSHVARKPVNVTGLMAHEKSADLADARRFGVELWAEEPMELVVPITSHRLLYRMTRPSKAANPVFAAPLDSTSVLLCSLPLGLDRTRARMPRMAWLAVDGGEFTAYYLRHAPTALRQLLRREPENLQALNSLAYLSFVQERFAEALTLYGEMARRSPGDLTAWERIAHCALRLERAGDEHRALQNVVTLSRQRGDAARATVALQRLQALEAERRR